MVYYICTLNLNSDEIKKSNYKIPLSCFIVLFLKEKKELGFFYCKSYSQFSQNIVIH